MAHFPILLSKFQLLKNSYATNFSLLIELLIKFLLGFQVTVQTGLRIYCADRTKREFHGHIAHRAAILNGHMRNSSACLNCYVFSPLETVPGIFPESSPRTA